MRRLDCASPVPCEPPFSRSHDLMVVFCFPCVALHSLQPGSFLLRFSKSQPGSLVVGYVAPNNTVMQCLIHPSPEGAGYVLGDKTYPTLEDIIQVNAGVLRAPLLASQFASAVPELPRLAPSPVANTVHEHTAMDAYSSIMPPRDFGSGSTASFASASTSFMSAPVGMTPQAPAFPDKFMMSGMGTGVSSAPARVEYSAIPRGGGSDFGHIPPPVSMLGQSSTSGHFPLASAAADPHAPPGPYGHSMAATASGLYGPMMVAGTPSPGLGGGHSGMLPTSMAPGGLSRYAASDPSRGIYATTVSLAAPTHGSMPQQMGGPYAQSMAQPQHVGGMYGSIPPQSQMPAYPSPSYPGMGYPSPVPSPGSSASGLYASLPDPARSGLPSTSPSLSNQGSSSSVSTSGGRACGVCCEEKSKWVVLVPCGHPMCADCCGKLKSKTCPFCRTDYETANNLFL